MNSQQLTRDIDRLHADLRQQYRSLETDEARDAFLSDIAAQVGHTTPEAISVWLTTTTQVLGKAARKASSRHPIALPRRLRKRYER